MAITLVGSTTAEASATTGVTNNVPAGVVNGDLLVWIVGQTTATLIATPTAGWTALQTGANTAVSLHVWYRFAASEPASYITPARTASRGSGVMLAYRGVHATTPFDVTTPAFVGGTTTTTCPAVTPVTAGAWVGSAVSVNVASGVVNTVLSSGNTTIDGQVTSTQAASSNNASGGSHFAWTSGAFTPAWSASNATVRTLGGSFVLRPAAGGPATLQGAAALTATSTLTVAGIVAKEAAVALTGTATLTATGFAVQAAALALTATSTLTATVPAGMVEFSEDFEGAADTVGATTSTTTFNGNTNPSATMTHSTLRSITGTRSLRIQNPTATQGLYRTVAPARTLAYRRVYWYSADMTTGTVVMSAQTGATTNGSNIQIPASGAIRLRDVTTVVATSSITAVVDQWYRFEQFVDSAAGTHRLRVFTGANLHGTVPDDEISGALTVGTWDRLTLGTNAANTLDWFWDTYADGTLDWIGPAAVVGITQNAVAALTATSTLTVAAVRQPEAAISLTAAASLTATAVRDQLAVVGLTGVSTLTVAGIRQPEGTVALTGVSTLTATATEVNLAVAALTAVSALTATAVRVPQAAASLVATATLTVTAVRQPEAAASLTATSTLAATADRTAVLTATLTAVSTLTATAVREPQATVSLTATATLTATAAREQAALIALVATATLSVTAVVISFPYTEPYTGVDNTSWPAPWQLVDNSGGQAEAKISGNQGYLHSLTAAHAPVTMLLNHHPLADQEVACDVTMGDATDDFAVVLRASTTVDSGVRLTVTRRNDTWGWILEVGAPLAAPTVLGSNASFLTNPSVDTLKLRYQVTGTAVRVRLWDPAGAEPGGWTADTTQAAVSAAGYVGVTGNGAN